MYVNNKGLTNNIYVNQNLTKQIQSLKTRLDFAQFKLSQGWENKSMVDVERFWKLKQRKQLALDQKITLRFTQRDIIDKKSPSYARNYRYGIPLYYLKQKNNALTRNIATEESSQPIQLLSGPLESFSLPPTLSFNPIHSKKPEENITRNSLDCLSYAIDIAEKYQNEHFGEDTQNSQQSLPSLVE